MVKRARRHSNSNNIDKDDGKSTRRLRSKEETNTECKPTLFNFEDINGLLYRDERIEVSSETSFENLYHSMNDAELPPKYKISRGSTIEIKEELLPRRTKHYENILPDEIYEPFHRKMRKEERTMVNSDRLRILSEVDNLQCLLQKLNQYDWARHLPAITYIRDTRDYNELEEKKKLTIAEIGSILEKYDDWKRRQDKLNSDIREFDISRGEEKESDEYTAPLEILKQRRAKQRRDAIGPIIKLRLNNGYSLIIDPVLAPKIVRTDVMNTPKTGQAKEEPVLELNFGENMDHITTEQNRNRIKPLKLESIPDKSKLNLKYDETKKIAFGRSLPTLGDMYTDFELFPSWTRKADMWINRRKKLRKTLDETTESLPP